MQNERLRNASAEHATNFKDRVVINVGGTRHECYISTIQNFPDTRLYWIAETALKMADFDPDGNEFFFDRHPGCFQNILNYCRTGKLHCPNDVCGPLFEEELQFWGIDELVMEPCCWGYYTQHREANKTLKMFDDLYEEQEETYEGETKHGTCGLRKSLGNIKNTVWRLLEKPERNPRARLVTLAILLVTVLSVTTFCLETMDRFRARAKQFYALEIFYCAFFTVDFMLRLICCPSKIRFVKSSMAWMDFLSTGQFYVTIFSRTDVLSFLFMLRLLRIFRLLRFFKNFSGMIVIGQTLKASARELVLLVIMLFVPMVIFSTMVYFAEKGITAEKFTSIPDCFWWAIITMTTVGYGDVVPTSEYGKLLGAICAFSGCLVVALPVSVIGNNFSFYYSYAQARMRLPKRQHKIMLKADKVLFTNEKNLAGNKENPVNIHSRSRRYAISPLAGPIKFFSDKKTKKTSVLHPATNGSSLKPLVRHDNQGSPRAVQNVYKPVAKHDNEKSPLSFHKEYTSKKMRSLTVYEQPNLLSNHMPALTRSYDGMLNEQESPARDRRRILHLDISAYEPAKLHASVHASRRKNSRYHHPLIN